MRIIKRVWITGANGQLGKALNQLIDTRKIEVLNTDFEEVDITDVQEVIAYGDRNRPDVIINCAAFTAVDECELDPDKAFRINALGARNLAISARKIGARIVHISTDYVFSGDHHKPYQEFDAVDPQSAYGRSKLAGENFVKELAPKYFIVRTSWLYGEGNNFVQTILRLGQVNRTVRVVDDQVGSPTSAKELAKMILCLMDTAEYGLYHASCEGSTSWYDLAKEVFLVMDDTIKVLPIKTSEYPTPAKRPAYSVLDNYMLRLSGIYQMAGWKECLVDYLEEIKKGEEGQWKRT